MLYHNPTVLLVEFFHRAGNHGVWIMHIPIVPIDFGCFRVDIAFPDGSMTASGLRRESARGHLLIESIAGKDYTTMANIERMRELCRVEAKVRGCGSGSAAAEPPSGSSSITAASYHLLFSIPQYTALPPEISNTAPVENEHSSEASHATSAAISSTSTKRFIGIFASM